MPAAATSFTHPPTPSDLARSFSDTSNASKKASATLETPGYYPVGAINPPPDGFASETATRFVPETVPWGFHKRREFLLVFSRLWCPSAVERGWVLHAVCRVAEGEGGREETGG